MKRYGWTCEGPGNWKRGEWSLGWYDDDGPTGWWLNGPGVWAKYLAWYFVDAAAVANEYIAQREQPPIAGGLRRVRLGGAGTQTS